MKKNVQMIAQAMVDATPLKANAHAFGLILATIAQFSRTNQSLPLLAKT
jgi:hypothetical protein